VPRLGTLNIHASLLPLLRGAAPIQAAIREGFEETGVSVMRMVEKLDAGPVLLQRHVPILADETAGELQLRLAELGAQTLIEALSLMEAGAGVEEKQDDERATYAPKITREMARIDWRTGGDAVFRTIRAYDPRPGAWCRLRGTETRLFGARLVPGKVGEPGTVLGVEKNGMVVACGDDAVLIVVAQPAGKRRMSPMDLLSGRQLSPGDVLE
jgi:methionyl-tRNA formyltransferase